MGWFTLHVFAFQPHVDFGLKLFGADLMSIPGLYRFVQVQLLTIILILFVFSPAISLMHITNCILLDLRRWYVLYSAFLSSAEPLICLLGSGAVFRNIFVPRYEYNNIWQFGFIHE